MKTIQLLVNGTMPIRQVYNHSPAGNTIKVTANNDTSLEVSPNTVRALNWEESPGTGTPASWTVPVRNNDHPESSLVLNSCIKHGDGYGDVLQTVHVWYKPVTTHGSTLYGMQAQVMPDGEVLDVPLGLTSESGYIQMAVDGDNGTIVIGDFIVDPTYALDSPHFHYADPAGLHGKKGLIIYYPWQEAGTTRTINFTFHAHNCHLYRVKIDWQDAQRARHDLIVSKNQASGYNVESIVNVTIPPKRAEDNPNGYEGLLQFAYSNDNGATWNDSNLYMPIVPIKDLDTGNISYRICAGDPNSSNENYEDAVLTISGLGNI